MKEQHVRVVFKHKTNKIIFNVQGGNGTRISATSEAEPLLFQMDIYQYHLIKIQKQ